jgi:hypothetical protein
LYLFFFPSSFDGLGRLACSHPELVWNYESYKQSVEVLGLGISSPQGRSVHRTTQRQKECKNISLPRVKFELTIQVSKRAKTFSALDRTATVTGPVSLTTFLFHVCLSPDLPLPLKFSKKIFIFHPSYSFNICRQSHHP